MHGWPLVRLGDLLVQSIDRHPVETGKFYPNIGICGFGRGVFEKPAIDGGSFGADHLYRLRAGQFIYSRLKAFEGAYGLVPEFGDGAYVTNEFPVFDIDNDRVLPRYIYWYFRRSATWEQLARHSIGLGARRERLHPNALLAQTVPLPPLTVQERLVAKVEAVGSRIDEARRLRNEVRQGFGVLLVAMAHRNDLSAEVKRALGWRELRLGDVIAQTTRPVTVIADELYPNVGIYSFGKGLFQKSPIDGTLSSAKTLYRIKAGELIYSRLFAFEGAFGLVPAEFDGYYVSNEYPTFKCDPEIVLAEFLLPYFKSPNVWRTLTGDAVGLGDRRKRIKPDVVLRQRLWLPPLHWQEEIKSVAARVDQAAIAYSGVDRELDALLPAVLDKAFKGEL